MIQSMTGFGKAESQLQNKKFTVEIKCLNSKQQDFHLRLPNQFKALEMDCRRLLAKHLVRGKISLSIALEQNQMEQERQLNHDLIAHYMAELKKIEPKASNLELMPMVMSMPNVLVAPEESISQEEVNTFLQCLQIAINAAVEFRKDEGALLEQEFQNRIENILHLLQSIAPLEQERMHKIREKIYTQLNDFTNNINKDRLEQEMIYYLERLDIAEEKQRLQQHCNYFLQELKQTESNGKKLGFISQEIGREINTLGSKANHSDIQKIVVQMKDELEKIKEQILNVL